MDDIRELPAYSISEVAHYLTLPAATVRYWSVGRGEYKSLIEVPRRSPTLLSFHNLVELHILATLRRKHTVTMPKVREAIQYLVETIEGTDRRYPLLSHNLETNGLDLLIEQYGLLINLNRSGQLSMRQIMCAALKRITRDIHGIPINVYPFTGNSIENAPSIIVIDPAISAGRPVIKGTGIATQIIAERYKAGDSFSKLARDYDRKESEIQEAIRCELPAAA